MADQSPQTSPKLRFFFSRIFPWLFILFGALCVYLGVLAIYRGIQSLTWPTTQGRIEKASVVNTGSNNGYASSKIAVTYTFTVDGKQYKGDRIAFSYATMSSCQAVNSLCQYPKGKVVSVSYEPDDPSLCVLTPGVQQDVWQQTAMGAIFFITGALLAVVLPIVMPRSNAGPVSVAW